MFKFLAAMLVWRIFRHALGAVLALALLVLALSWAGTAHAQNVAQAQAGKVLTVQRSLATSNQGDRYSNYNRQNDYDSYQSDHARAIIGGLLGTAVGSVIGGGNGRRVAMAAGAAVGAAVGNRADVNAQRREARQDNRSAQDSRLGYQVIVKLDGGRTVAVFTHYAKGFHPGEKVWVIGQDRVIPAS